VEDDPTSLSRCRHPPPPLRYPILRAVRRKIQSPAPQARYAQGWARGENAHDESKTPIRSRCSRNHEPLKDRGGEAGRVPRIRSGRVLMVARRPLPLRSTLCMDSRRPCVGTFAAPTINGPARWSWGEGRGGKDRHGGDRSRSQDSIRSTTGASTPMRTVYRQLTARRQLWPTAAKIGAGTDLNCLRSPHILFLRAV
jgi:hypothetical protein